MNYLRGAINTISAPYQYYREINPATLTGAIDVIVVQRPTSTGATKLACSPFHVRFGKWQVLRPSEKKVRVSVNGHTIPFDMKIGDAGEAFFVFETDDDVPEDLITSPILHPTRTEDEGTGKEGLTDRFGARQDPDKREDNAVDPSATPKTPAVEEPEFLDLDAGPSNRKRPSGLSLSDSPVASPLPLATPSSMLALDADQRVDEALKVAQRSSEEPQVQYKSDVALDGEGYHARSKHDRERTITADDEGTMRSRTPSPTPKPPPALPKLDVEYSWEWGAFPQPSPLKTTFVGGVLTGGKDVSATWGRSPRARAGLSQIGVDATLEENEEQKLDSVEASGSGARSRSVPPDLEGSPTRTRRRARERLAELDGADDDDSADTSTSVDETVGFGAGGRLTASKFDPTKFTVTIEGKKVDFELSLVPQTPPEDDEDDEIDARGRRDRNGATGGVSVFDRRNEVEAARLFEKGQVDLDRLLEDESVVRDPRLIIRWSGDHYITRGDGSPLMDALVLWRNALIQQTKAGIPIRPTSPSTSEDSETPPDTPTDSDDYIQRQVHNRSKSEPPEQIPKRKPTSSSWVQWWSRSKSSSNAISPTQESERPPLPWSASEPNNSSEKKTPKRATTTVPPPADSAPVPSTPVQRPVEPILPPNPSPPGKGKKFAKTLRLTSDQLKSLNLKRGANSITFSLSTSNVIACTARIFVWDSTDLVLVSDIDGTITKSDALGHVFAMVGRDWTHSGVAKLYTDITRNGYKIMYLTSRAIGQADATRDYLKGIKQNDYQLPEGPVIMSPDRLMASLHREVIMRKPEVFKMACLRDIQRLFGEAARNPFYAGFGNRITDALSYRSVNVPSSRIFTIDSTGEVKLELLELAGYKSSYIHMTDLVDQMFPPIHRKWTPEYTDFNYWKPPVQEFALPDLSPPSPALSARSDTSSTLQRLRNFSLVGRQPSNARQAALNKVNGSTTPKSRETSPPPMDLHQMSSFERLSNTLSSSFGRASSIGSARRSLSPESYSSSSNTFADSDDEEDDPLDADGKQRRRRDRRRSMTSMPGSLHDDEDLQFDMEDEDVQNVEYDEEMHQDEEEAFDEDLLAAGEMKNVPFL